MARVSPFRGIRYDPSRIDLADVLAPPYDVIGAQQQEELHARAMQNMVRIELGKEYPDDVPGERDRYSRARDHLRIWLEQGFLIADPEPALYLHRHSFRAPGEQGLRHRLGCFAAVEPVAHQRREILRHELTLSGPREDRLRLLQATGVQTSPVFLLYQNSAAVTSELRRLMAALDPVGTATVYGEHGPESHALWRVTDPDSLATICEGLGRARLFIADGHHRYETALRLHLPAFLALLAPLDDPGNVILPTHRVLPQSGVTADQLMTRLAGMGWEVAASPSLAALEARLAELRSTHHAFGILDSNSRWVAARRRQVPDRAGDGATLDVAVLEREVLEAQLGVVASDAEGGRLTYTRDPAEVERLVRRRGALGFLVNPTSVEEMADVALAGEAMPQKSTYFVPKVPAGLVLLRTG